MINNEIVTLANKANATELESIRLFKRRAVELSENSRIRNSYRSSVDLQLNNEEGPSLFIESLPSEEAFRSLLLTFRHFSSWFPIPRLGTQKTKLQLRETGSWSFRN